MTIYGRDDGMHTDEFSSIICAEVSGQHSRMQTMESCRILSVLVVVFFGSYFEINENHMVIQDYLGYLHWWNL